MIKDRQRTLRKKVSLSGIALHTGVRAHLTLKPAPENTGICFMRVDFSGGSLPVRAVAYNVVDVRRGTTIAAGNTRVHTIEHILSSLNASQIDNAFVELDGPEPPIADGSAMPYLEMISDAGIVEQNAAANIWKAREPIFIEEGDTKLLLVPDERLKITCFIAYGATPLDAQYYSNEINMDIFRSEIAPARTFCLYKELEQLLSMGLIKGGSLDNAVVMHDGAVISKDGLRYPNEFVRHKILDIIGDIYLVGCRINAHIIAVKPGHPTNVLLARKMIEQYEKVGIMEKI